MIEAFTPFGRTEQFGRFNPEAFLPSCMVNGCSGPLLFDLSEQTSKLS